MRVVFAPDSFKGSIRSAEAAEAMAAGWRSVRPDDELICLPLADGGEATLDAFERGDALRQPVTVEGPAGAPVETSWLLIPATPTKPATGVVELASTVGFELLDTPQPLDASSYGFGEAIRAALEAGVTRLMLAAAVIAGESDAAASDLESTTLVNLAGSSEAAQADPAHWLREAAAELARRVDASLSDTP